MNTTLSRPKTVDAGLLASGAAAGLMAAGALTNTFASLGIGDRAALIGLAVAGMAMCARGPLSKSAEYGWANPRHLLGYAAGALALVTAGARLFNQALPWAASDRGAIGAISLIILVKVVVALTYPRRA
ncbi:MAG TPA: hypothetical protein PJ988_00405 [Anaerolinea sp.]|nr:hypothetical protein [Anaerolinea sp.]